MAEEWISNPSTHAHAVGRIWYLVTWSELIAGAFKSFSSRRVRPILPVTDAYEIHGHDHLCKVCPGRMRGEPLRVAVARGPALTLRKSGCVDTSCRHKLMRSS